jgi:hypothetical protein
MSYTKDGTTRAYRVRAISFAHGLVQVADESHARTMRAYYPHRRSQAQFQVTLLLMGRRQIHDHSEYERFNVWLKGYMDFLLDQDDQAEVALFPRLTVSIPTRGFSRVGIPLGPLQWGEHVGSMLWTQTINFETTREPTDKDVPRSNFDNNGTDKDRNSRFFYPGSKTTLNGNQRPDVYDGVFVTPYDSIDATPNWGDVQNAANGTPAAPPPMPGPDRVRAGGL